MRLLLLPLALFACAALYVTTSPIPDVQSQALFDDAIEWSKKEGLETAGCFDLIVVGKASVVAFATEKVHWRRPMRVQFACNIGQGIWHTHWLPESDSTVGCNLLRAEDRATMGPHHPLGVVICGKGRDSVRYYTWDTTMARIRKVKPITHKNVRMSCTNEPPASLQRGHVDCTTP
jgi:hypothetical protein